MKQPLCLDCALPLTRDDRTGDYICLRCNQKYGLDLVSGEPIRITKTEFESFKSFTGFNYELPISPEPPTRWCNKCGNRLEPGEDSCLNCGEKEDFRDTFTPYNKFGMVDETKNVDIDVVQKFDAHEFQALVQCYINNGWKVSSTASGVIANGVAQSFWYQAIMVKDNVAV